jgi:hypothetical protein
VKICRSYAIYNGDVVATTNPDGYFESPFAYIPGDEMVHVWALADGYTFDPPFYYWRHYAYVEIRTADFVASPGPTASAPPYPCFPAPPPFGP